MSRWGKRDVNHGTIRAAFDAISWPYTDTSAQAGLGCDFIVRHVEGYAVFLEVKRPGPPSCRKLTESERRLQALFPNFYRIAQSPEEALCAVGLVPL